MLVALFLPPLINDTRWYHIRRSVTLARLGCLLMRGLLTGAGLGFVLVHCERTCVECRDNVDHHYTPLHSCCSCSDSTTTHPIRCCQGHRCSKVQCQSVGYFCSTEVFCPISQSDKSQCCSSNSSDIKCIVWMQLVFHILILSSQQGQLILAKLCYRGSDLHQLYKCITSIQVIDD